VLAASRICPETASSDCPLMASSLRTVNRSDLLPRAPSRRTERLAAYLNVRSGCRRGCDIGHHYREIGRHYGVPVTAETGRSSASGRKHYGPRGAVWGRPATDRAGGWARVPEVSFGADKVSALVGHEVAQNWLIGSQFFPAVGLSSVGLFIALQPQGGAVTLSSHPGPAGLPPSASQPLVVATASRHEARRSVGDRAPRAARARRPA
jgi:hypothetical protein